MKKIVYFLITIIIFCNSCSDSFLELSNPSTLSPAYFPANIGDLELLVTSCYVSVSDFYLYGKRVMGKGALVVDHTLDLAWIQDPHWNEMATNAITVGNDYVQSMWFGYYEVVSQSNMVLFEADRINTDAFSNEDLARLEQIKGEAYFWRGWAYQQLVQFWGEGYPCNGDGSKRGVIVHTARPSSLQAMNIDRSTVDEVYEQVLSDYAEAERRLPDSWSSTANKSRPTKYSVRSFRGQAYLLQGAYESAKSELKGVIDNSGKNLLPFDEYAKMFTEDQTKFNNESIQEINFKNGTSNPEGWGNWAGGEGSMYAMLVSMQFINDEGEINNAGWSNLFFHEANIDRFGSDPRLYITAVEPGTKTIVEGEEVTVMKFMDSGDSRGWPVRKYNPITFSTYSVTVSVGINMYLMRLADVYLMYAEACQATNDEANAREYANKVRRRAFDLPVDTPSAVDITSSGTQLRDDIREERFLELCGEGVQHWIDVCRWKTLDKEISQWYNKTAVGPPVYAAKSLYFPIPRAELENNPAITQSTGYENQ